MKKLIFVFTILIVFVVSACKKSTDSTNITVTPTVVGYWSGNFAFTVTPTSNVVMYALLRSDGTARVYAASTDTSAAAKENGTYTSSDSVRIHVGSGIAERTYSGKMNTSATSMNGTFGQATNTSGLGTFALTK